MALFKAEKIKTTEIPALLHPPLVEAIFELRWELQTDQQSGRMRDPSYPMMYGRLYERLKKDFPIVEDLPSTQAHPEATPFTPRHRLRKEKTGYPLLQVGPGILTINDAKGYSWTQFKALVERLIESIVELYGPANTRLNFIKAEMRYVNAVRFDITRENPLAFLEEKLHTKIGLDEELFDQDILNDRPGAVGLNVSYQLKKPIGSLGLSINLGQMDGKPAYVFQTLIQTFGEMVPSDREAFTPWLQEAHDAAEHCFGVLCKGALMNKFCGI